MFTNVIIVLGIYFLKIEAIFVCPELPIIGAYIILIVILKNKLHTSLSQALMTYCNQIHFHIYENVRNYRNDQLGNYHVLQSDLNNFLLLPNISIIEYTFTLSVIIPRTLVNAIEKQTKFYVSPKQVDHDYIYMKD
jgi:hypothetical protein